MNAFAADVKKLSEGIADWHSVLVAMIYSTGSNLSVQGQTLWRHAVAAFEHLKVETDDFPNGAKNFDSPLSFSKLVFSSLEPSLARLDEGESKRSW